MICSVSGCLDMCAFQMNFFNLGGNTVDTESYSRLNTVYTYGSRLSQLLLIILFFDFYQFSSFTYFNEQLDILRIMLIGCLADS